MKIQMPECMDVLALVAAHLAVLKTQFGRLRSRTVHGSAPGALEQAMALHEPNDRWIRSHGSKCDFLLHPHSQVVVVQLVTPTGMLPILLGQDFTELGTQGRLLAA